MAEWERAIGDIPGNARSLRRLHDLIRAGEAIAFLGAGTSVPLYPTWDELLALLLDRAREHGATDSQLGTWRRRSNRPIDIAARIQDELGTGQFASLVRELFGPREPDRGGPSTPAQDLIVQCPFRGIVTTNYDPGILEARSQYRPAAPTSYLSCNQSAIRLWEQTGADFFPNDPLPVLFAHGHYLEGEQIILTRPGYRRAYAGPLRHVMVHLLRHQHLVWIGWGFRDPWVEAFHEQVAADLTDFAESPHIAIVGWEPADGEPRELRIEWAQVHRTDLLLYPLGNPGPQRHVGLLHILRSLADPSVSTRTAASPTPPTVIEGDFLERQRWVHSTTEDSGYLDRPRQFEALDRYTTEPGVAIVALTGIGGLGKTSLVGHWAKQRCSAAVRTRYRALFYWSWYVSDRTNDFLVTLSDWVLAEFPDLIAPQRERALREVLRSASLDARTIEDRVAPLLASIPMLIVLDGLEVVQDAIGPAGGRFLDSGLATFVRHFGQKPQVATLLMTSRFAFIDLRPFLGLSARVLPLEALSIDESTRLLRRLQVPGTEAEHRRLAEAFDGHPLALRVVAAVADGPTDKISTLRDLIAETDEGTSLGVRLGRLLQFYEKRMDAQARALLAVVSLFRSPVAESTLLRLRSASRNWPASSDSITAQSLRNDMLRLKGQGLVMGVEQRNDTWWSAHPVVRDHFRRLASGSPAARMAAVELSLRPLDRGPIEAAEVANVINAIEILLDSGDVGGAHQLLDDRFLGGIWFHRSGEVDIGWRCIHQFVRTQHDRRRLRKTLKRQVFIRCLSSAAGLASDVGEVTLADFFYSLTLTASRRSRDKQALPVRLRNASNHELYYGRFASARSLAAEALESARSARAVDSHEVKASLVRLAAVLSIAGDPARADECLYEVTRLGGIERSHDDLGALVEVFVGHALLTRRPDAAHEMATSWLDSLSARHNMASVAEMHWALAKVSIAHGDAGSALEDVERSRSALPQRLPAYDAAALSLVSAEAYLQLARLNEALQAVDEALALAAPRGWILLHIEALVLRGRAYLADPRDEGRGPRALASAESALHLAREVGYIWGEADALELLSEACVVSGHAANGQEYANASKSLRQRLDAAIASRPAPRLLG